MDNVAEYSLVRASPRARSPGHWGKQRDVRCARRPLAMPRDFRRRKLHHIHLRESQSGTWKAGLKPILPAVLCCLKFLIEPAILSLFLRIWPCPETCKWSLLLMGLTVVRILPAEGSSVPLTGLVRRYFGHCLVFRWNADSLTLLIESSSPTIDSGRSLGPFPTVG